MEMFKKKSDYLIAGLIFAIIGLLLVVSFDSLFSPPIHLKGQIVEKIFVPAHIVTGGPYGGNRRGNYMITTAAEEQWIAIVKTDTGDTLKVHCHSSHYEDKNVGDVITFNKYDGHLFHIDYFAHNEEE
jgi:hypothetical protein